MLKPDYAQQLLMEKLTKDLTLKPATFKTFSIKTELSSLDLSETEMNTLGHQVLTEISANVFLNNISDKLAARIISEGTLQFCKDSKTLSLWLRREGNPF